MTLVFDYGLIGSVGVGEGCLSGAGGGGLGRGSWKQLGLNGFLLFMRSLLMLDWHTGEPNAYIGHIVLRLLLKIFSIFREKWFTK